MRRHENEILHVEQDKEPLGAELHPLRVIKSRDFHPYCTQ